MHIHPIAHYTRFVYSAKVLLGILVVVLIGMMFLYPVVKKNRDVRVAFTSIEKTVKPPPTQMVKANFRGFDQNNQPYNITADTALQSDEDNIAFNKINADITLNSGVWLSLQADKGSMKIKEHLLFLNGSVEMFNDEGYELRTDTMVVDIAKKMAVTHDVVKGQGPMGTLKSQGAVFYGDAKRAVFGGRVFVTVYMASKAPATKQRKS